MTSSTVPAETSDSAFFRKFGITIVFYHPDVTCVDNANRLAALGWRVVVVDNTPVAPNGTPTSSSVLSAEVRIIANGVNRGIAAALNQGVDALMADGFSAAILFDQDSMPSENLLFGLATAAQNAMAKDVSVALVGPAYQDFRSNTPAPFIRFRALKAKQIPACGQEPVEVDFLITSGSCVNLRVWGQIGQMDESLFIDSVDLEWCMRARAKGFRVLGIPWLVLPHALGGQPVMVLGRAYPTHSALRHYYMCRNVMALCLRSYVPWTWKSIELVKMPLRLAVYAMYFKPGMHHVRMAWRGLFDGVIGRMGEAKVKR